MIEVKYLCDHSYSLEVTGLQGRDLATLSTIIHRPGSELIKDWLSLGLHLYAGLLIPEEKPDADNS